MRNRVCFKREIPLKIETEVLIVGGGPSGVAAALAARRLGKRVFLAEAGGMFGGMGTAGLVPTFCPFDDGENVVAAGIGYEIRKKISSTTPLGAYGTPICVEELKRVYDNLMEEAGVDFVFFTSLVDVEAVDGHIEYVVLSGKTGLYGAKAGIYLDCTGDGTLCALAGAPFEIGDETGDVQPGTLCSLWADVDFQQRKAPDDSQLEAAFRDGVFGYEDRHLPGMFDTANGSRIAGGNLGHTDMLKPLDERSLTREIIRGRRMMQEYERYYKSYLTGFERMKLVVTAGVLGIRESRRIVCDYMLCGEDFLRRAVFEDEIGRYCYPVDLHVKATDKERYSQFWREFTQDYRYQKGESYGIPYRSLCPASLSNVLVAGRCIGVDRRMQASIRVMPGCFITGQAAGAAAALALETQDIRRISVRELQGALLKLGAYLPNARP